MGTTDGDLIKMAKDLGIKSFRGCFMRDTLPTHPLDYECGIINFQGETEGNGSHWSCFWKEGESKIFFDSFGTNPPGELVKYLGNGILSSTFQVQRINSDICGELCILVLYLLDRGHSFEEIILDTIFGLG